MKKRVLIITPFLMQGGVEHSLITALSGLDYNRFDITLFLYKEELSLLPYVPADVHVIKGFDKTHYYRKPLSAFLLCLSRFMKIIHNKKAEMHLTNRLNEYIHACKVTYPKKTFFNNHNFDVIISYCLHLGTEMAITLSAEKHYLFLHNSHIEYHEDIFQKCKSRFDAFFCVSKGVKDVYSKAYPKLAKQLYVITNYVDATEILYKAKMNLLDERSNNKTILCTCGRLATEKGFDLAVETAKELKETGYSFYWYFVGDGYQRKELEGMIYQYDLGDFIEITGYKDNPYPYIDCCNIYIQPSYEESQGLAIYEALILGKAVVSTDTIGGRCTLDNGQKGILTDISAEGLTDGIKRLIDDKELLHSYENCITIEENIKEKQAYYEKWKKLLNAEY